MRFLVDVWFLVFFMAAIVSASSFADLSVEEWNEFKAFHGKAYSTSVEEEFRMKIYLENKLKIAQHNQLAQGGHRSYFLKMNHMGDFLPSEIAALHGLRKDHNRDPIQWHPENPHQNPHELPKKTYNKKIMKNEFVYGLLVKFDFSRIFLRIFKMLLNLAPGHREETWVLLPSWHLRVLRPQPKSIGDPKVQLQK